VDARGNQRWQVFSYLLLDRILNVDRNCFKSDKIAEISYASQSTSIPLHVEESGVSD
jgi:hypothetical protein